MTNKNTERFENQDAKQTLLQCQERTPIITKAIEPIVKCQLKEVIYHLYYYCLDKNPETDKYEINLERCRTSNVYSNIERRCRLRSKDMANAYIDYALDLFKKVPTNSYDKTEIYNELMNKINNTDIF